MRKVVIFLLILALGLGAVGYASAAMFALEDQVTFTQNVVFGDPGTLSGLTARFHYNGGDHLHWYTDYAFGAEPAYETDFQYRRNPPDPVEIPRSEVSVQGFTGGGMTMSSSRIDLGDSLIARMARDVSLQTPNGESRSMELRISDYTDHYPLSTYIQFTQPGIYCDLHADMLLENDTGMSEYDLEQRRFLEEFAQLFRFPVQEDTVYEISVDKDMDGNIYSVSIQSSSGPEYGCLSTVNENGLYLIPYFRDAEGRVLRGEYPEGMGIYYIPWKTVGEFSFKDAKTGKTEQGRDLMPDLSGTRKICSLPENVQCAELRISEDRRTGWLLAAQEGFYTLTVVDLEQAQLKNTLTLTPTDESSRPRWPDAVFADGYLVILSGGQLALVDLAGDAAVEFITDAGALTEQDEMHIFYLSNDLLRLRYEDGLLVVLSPSYFDGQGFWAAACTAEGLQYLGLYNSSLDAMERHGYNFSVTKRYNPIQLQ